MQRRDLDGLWDRMAQHGPITGSGPNFDKAMAAFKQRQAEAGKVGTWRRAPASWKKNHGTFIDRDWDLVDY